MGLRIDIRKVSLLRRRSQMATAITGKRIFQAYRPGLRSVCASAQQLRESYHEKGYAVIRNAICPSLVAETQEHVEWLMDRYPGVPPEKLQHPLSFVDPFWLRLVSEPQLVDLAETYLGTGDIALFVSHYVCKMPGSGQQVKWHQDASYFDVESSTPGALAEPLNLWLPVDRATQHNGCLQVIPGSHKRGSMEVQSTDSGDVLGSTVAQDVDESTAEFIELEPGDVSIHHPLLLHGSAKNTSEARRCGLNIRYISTGTKVKQDLGDDLFLMRGQPQTEVNKYRPYPRYEAGKHMPFDGCEDWNAVKLTRQGEGVPEFGPEDELKREKLANYFVKLSAQVAQNQRRRLVDHGL